MSAFTEFLVLLVCLCLTGIATGDTITVNLTINSDNPDCVGGQVGLTNTSILVHYRLYESTSPVEEWTFLSEIHISEGEQIVDPVIFTNISATGVQLRWWYTPAIMIFMTFFLVKYLAKGAGTEAK